MNLHRPVMGGAMHKGLDGVFLLFLSQHSLMLLSTFAPFVRMGSSRCACPLLLFSRRCFSTVFTHHTTRLMHTMCGTRKCIPTITSNCPFLSCALIHSNTIRAKLCQSHIHVYTYIYSSHFGYTSDEVKDKNHNHWYVPTDKLRKNNPTLIFQRENLVGSVLKHRRGSLLFLFLFSKEKKGKRRKIFSSHTKRRKKKNGANRMRSSFFSPLMYPARNPYMEGRINGLSEVRDYVHIIFPFPFPPFFWCVISTFRKSKDVILDRLFGVSWCTRIHIHTHTHSVHCEYVHTCVKYVCVCVCIEHMSLYMHA